jgi:ribosome biogenesis GTPase / thiamine phosphate phosphatase
MDLIDLGWNSFFEKEFEQYKNNGFAAARIAQQHRRNYIALSEKGEFLTEVSGKFRHEANTRGQFPAVGDWVALSVRVNENGATIHALLPRQSVFLRKEAGVNTEEQVVAANIDTVFIVCGLDGDFNLRRIERYLILAWESGAVPVILLNKCDLCHEFETRVNEVESLAIGVSLHAISAADGSGFDCFEKYLVRGKTSAFLGSSGVGKSSIINRLLGEERLRVNEVSQDNIHGRHTTTYRELIMLPNGGLVIDTPGMRELQVWGDEQGLKKAFEDIEEFAVNCRFRDCTHENEPGCAVQIAISDGNLDADRFKSFLKLRKELQYLTARQTMKASAVEKLRWKHISLLRKDLKKGHQEPI